nr:MAG TPA: hypothetical protein [Caudoviricetes sp.]
MVYEGSTPLLAITSQSIYGKEESFIFSFKSS